MLKDSLSPRLLKKVQMQGDAPGTHPEDGCRREAYCLTPLALSPSKGTAPRERAGHPPEVGHRRWAFFSSLIGASCCGPFVVTMESTDFRESDERNRGPVIVALSV
jgi:hypothetical protein